MSGFSFAAVLLVLASIFGSINYWYLRLPATIGLMVVSIIASLGLAALDAAVPGLGLESEILQAAQVRDLPGVLLDGALSFLLFAGALHVDVPVLWSRKLTILLLATVGVLLSTILFGFGIAGVFAVVGVPVPFVWCLVLGALLAPTDPVAVADLLGRIGIPDTLKAVMSGESLFNDGVGVLVFTVLLTVADSATPVSVGGIAAEFLWSTFGSAGLGLASGGIAYLMMRGIDDFSLEILISLALATGTYAAAARIGLSGPIAVVAAGLVIGSHGRRHAMSETTRHNLSLFWTVLDNLLNALLFLLLGFEVLAIELDQRTLVAMLLAVPVALAVRGVSVVLPVYWLHARDPDRWPSAAVLVWGGLRGGISVALALGLPPSAPKQDLLLVCYGVVVFTVVVQGLTIGRVIRLVFGSGTPGRRPRDPSARNGNMQNAPEASKPPD